MHLFQDEIVISNERKNKILAWSNAFFIIPIVIALLLGMIHYAILVSIILILSVFYHTSENSVFVVLDWASALFLITFNFILFLLGRFNDIYAYIIIPFTLITLFFNYREEKQGYVMNHAIWHILSAILTGLCILTFVF
ncbi:hypothetical protein ACFL1B_01820 [Nanoarchaeota archaeon]